jgi:hypothetical protein
MAHVKFPSVLVMLASALLLQQADAAQKRDLFCDTVGSFVFQDVRGNVSQPIKVWYYRPAQITPETRIVFLMHGQSRTGRDTRDIGMIYAQEHSFVLLAPEFSVDHYPGRRMYDFGNMLDSMNQMLPEREWTLLAIETSIRFRS